MKLSKQNCPKIIDLGLEELQRTIKKVELYCVGLKVVQDKNNMLREV